MKQKTTILISSIFFMFSGMFLSLSLLQYTRERFLLLLIDTFLTIFSFTTGHYLIKKGLQRGI